MIQPNAKCVVNGSKVNETIDALNPLLSMEVKVANIAEPHVQYGQDNVQITIPQPSNFTNEQLDVVDSSNTPSTRWFVTSTSQGESSASNTRSGIPINASQPSTTNKGRDKMPREGGDTNNRNNLALIDGGGNGFNVDNGDVGRPKQPIGALLDDGTTTRPKAPAGGGALLDDGTTTRPKAPAGGGALLDDGTTTRTSDKFLLPIVGAPPRESKPLIPKNRTGSKKRKRDYKGTRDISPGDRKSRRLSGSSVDIF